MKVKKLIDRLSKFPGDAEVRLNSAEGDEVLFASMLDAPDSPVWLQGEHDIDMKWELQARLEAVADGELDETDFYSGLIETGITVEMVGKYMGQDAADQMQKYCVEHGLL